jgi:hypothetical protein
VGIALSENKHLFSGEARARLGVGEAHPGPKK